MVTVLMQEKNREYLWESFIPSIKQGDIISHEMLLTDAQWTDGGSQTQFFHRVLLTEA